MYIFTFPLSVCMMMVIKQIELSLNMLTLSLTKKKKKKKNGNLSSKLLCNLSNGSEHSCAFLSSLSKTFCSFIKKKNFSGGHDR